MYRNVSTMSPTSADSTSLFKFQLYIPYRADQVFRCGQETLQSYLLPGPHSSVVPVNGHLIVLGCGPISRPQCKSGYGYSSGRM